MQDKLIGLGLKKLRESFYILPETENGGLSVDELLIMLHCFDPIRYINDPLNPVYEERRDEAIRSSPDPVLLGVEPHRTTQTVQWLRNLKPRGPRAIYITGTGRSGPYNTNDEDFVRAVIELFSPSKVKLGGAEVRYLDDGTPYQSCVHGLGRRLDHRLETQVVHELCFRVKSPEFEFPEFAQYVMANDPNRN